MLVTANSQKFKENTKAVRLKDKKQVGATISGKLGVNTTAVCCAGIAGYFVPPMIIFKRFLN